MNLNRYILPVTGIQLEAIHYRRNWRLIRDFIGTFLSLFYRYFSDNNSENKLTLATSASVTRSKSPDMCSMIEVS